MKFQFFKIPPTQEKDPDFINITTGAPGPAPTSLHEAETIKTESNNQYQCQ